MQVISWNVYAVCAVACNKWSNTGKTSNDKEIQTRQKNLSGFILHLLVNFLMDFSMEFRRFLFFLFQLLWMNPDKILNEWNQNMHFVYFSLMDSRFCWEKFHWRGILIAAGLWCDFIGYKWPDNKTPKRMRQFIIRFQRCARKIDRNRKIPHEIYRL